MIRHGEEGHDRDGVEVRGPGEDAFDDRLNNWIGRKREAFFGTKSDCDRRVVYEEFADSWQGELL